MSETKNKSTKSLSLDTVLKAEEPSNYCAQLKEFGLLSENNDSNESEQVKLIKQEMSKSQSIEFKSEEELKKKSIKDKCPLEQIAVKKYLKASLEEFYKKKLDESFNNADEIFGKIQNKFDDFIFEDKCIDLFKTKFNLKEFDAFPYFKKIKKKTGGNIIQINFYLINIKVGSEIKNYLFFEEAGKLFPINYDKKGLRFYALIEIDKNNKQENITYFFQDYNYLIRTELKNKDNKLISFLLEGQLEQEYLKMEKKKMEIQYLLLDLKEGEGKNKNKNEIAKLEKELENLIKDQDKSLKKKNIKIEITISKIERELDGFFQANEKIKVKNSIFGLEIEAKSFIIVEVKNYKKYQDILKNINFKKRLLGKLGINLKNVYFIGILFDAEEKDFEKKKENLIENNICIITGKDLLNEDEKIYENSQSNIYTLELKIKTLENKMENRMSNIENRMNNIENQIININSTLGMILKQLEDIKTQA